MNILFVHQNFPAQFKFLAPALAKGGHRVVALRRQYEPLTYWQGVEVKSYELKRGTTAAVHPWAQDFEAKAIRSEACLEAALSLRKSGFNPEIIIAHPGWGESLFLKEVWPEARLGIYCEFYYHVSGADVGFDPEFASQDLSESCRVQLKNINNLLHFEIADAGISPTNWQASTFPERFRKKITVVHDGIDTNALAPNPNVQLNIENPAGEKFSLTKKDEVITFVNRNLEPYRGYHTFMRALPSLLAQRPNARVLIVGGDDVSYGAKPADGRTWKQVFIDEVRQSISDSQWSRVYFLGKVPYANFIQLLQLSTVHVYLTYPFVLGWSLLEAMSVGCAIVASDTQPLHEAIRHNETGRLVDFFSHEALVNEVCALLEDPQMRDRLGSNAREFARVNYDLKGVCLPAQLAWVECLHGKS